MENQGYNELLDHKQLATYEKITIACKLINDTRHIYGSLIFGILLPKSGLQIINNFEKGRL
jgi:hypothetical protein